MGFLEYLSVGAAPAPVMLKPGDETVVNVRLKASQALRRTP